MLDYSGSTVYGYWNVSWLYNVITDSTCAAKHTGTVWQVEWVERETVSGEEKSEFLVSSAADGRISQWTIRKGFECTGVLFVL